MPSLLLDFNREIKMDQHARSSSNDRNAALEEDMHEYLEDLDESDG
jgi:hypothetical protein